MPDLSSAVPRLDPNDEIQFVGHHRVPLESGAYDLHVKQSVKLKNAPSPTHNFETKKTFAIEGNRFELGPDAVVAVFPPKGGRGDYWHAFPHIVLKRSTLPWERTALDTDSPNSKTDPPWLALLLFHGDEAPSAKQTKGGPSPTMQTITVDDLPANKATQSPFSAGIGTLPQFGLHPSDSVCVIDVSKKLLDETKMLPTDFRYGQHVRRRLAILDTVSLTKPSGSRLKTELEMILAARKETLGNSATITIIENGKRWHARSFTNPKDYEIHLSTSVSNDYIFYEVEHESAVVLGNRLPMPGKRNVAHLVSLEGYYDDGKPPYAFKFAGDSATETVRFVSLQSWEFYCEDPKKSFIQILNNLNATPANLRLPDPTATSMSQGVKDCLGSGFVPLRQRFRQGDRSLSWYHGPFLAKSGPIGDSTWRHQVSGELMVNTADQLLLFDKTTGLFDASYAAAWQLGRMLTLRNREVAKALYQWKRRHASSLHSARMIADYGYELPVNQQNDFDTETVPKINRWTEDLSLLKHVPFDYLAPDEKLLPQESIRFFQIDPLWVECLRDGAFSIGRVLSTDYEKDGILLKPSITQTGKLTAGDQSWVTLDKDASDEDDYYRHCRIRMTSGDSAGQVRIISSYKGNSNTAKLTSQWMGVGPSAKDSYEIAIFSAPIMELAGKVKIAKSKYIVLGDKASALNHHYRHCEIWITAGTGKGQRRFITKYIGLSHKASINRKWDKTPDSTSIYELYRPTRPMSGFLLRSEVVAGWPDLQINGYSSQPSNRNKRDDSDPGEDRLEPLRMERLSENILLCLFDAKLAMVDIHVKPEMLHFGFDEKPNADQSKNSGLIKKLRDADGNQISASIDLDDDSQNYWLSKSNRTANFTTVAAQIKANLPLASKPKSVTQTSTSDDLAPSTFALEMVSGTESVRFFVPPMT